MAKRRRCSKCKGLNHYAVTCKKGKKKGKKSKGAVRRYSTGSVTKSQRGRRLVGLGTSWKVFYHGGRTGDTQHDKTWAIKLVKKGGGWSVATRHGRRAGQKNETVRKSMSKDAAMRLGQSLIMSKLRKGYDFVGGNR